MSRRALWPYHKVITGGPLPEVNRLGPEAKSPLSVPKLRMSGVIPALPHTPSCRAQGQLYPVPDCVWNVMAHAQKPDFVFRRNERVHLNRRGLQFSRLLAAEVCASAVVILDRPCSQVVWRVLATHSIRQFPLHFPFRALPCAITFQLDSTY